MLAGIVALAAWAATSKPVLIAAERQRPEQSIHHQAQASDSNAVPSLSAPPPEQVKPKAQDGHAAEEKGEKGEGWLAIVEAVGVLLTGVFTGLLFAATYRLWNSTNRLAEGGERASERQLRAYVTIPEFEIQNVHITGYPRADISFYNSGLSPAYDFHGNLEMTIGPYPLPKGVTLPEPTIRIREGKVVIPQVSRGILGAQQPGSVNSTLDKPITADIFWDLKAGTKAIYVYGSAGYRDTFGKYWSLEYVYFCGGPADLNSMYVLTMDEKQTDKPNPRLHLAGPLEIPIPGLKPKA
jgi:hypothetical protein